MKKIILKTISIILVVLCVVGQSAFAFGITKVYYANDITDFAMKTADIISRYDAEAADNLRITGKTNNMSFNFYSLGAKECVVGDDGMFVLQFDSKTSLDSCLEFLSDNDEILYAEQDITIFSEAAETGSAENVSWGVEALGADAYAEYVAENHSDESVTVAIVDSGVEKIDYVASKLVKGLDLIESGTDGAKDTSSDGHGTFLASIITDCTKNANVSIMPVRVLESKSGSLINAISGIRYAVDNGADVINISLGGQLSNCKSLDNAILYAEENDVSVVVCSGNSKISIENYCPAHNETAITVSSVNEQLSFANGFSNYGDEVDMCAPGVNIDGYNASGEKVTMSGTSMSAAYISAGAALFRLQNPHCKPSQVQEAIKRMCTDLGKTGFDVYYGWGIPDFSKFTTSETVYAGGISFAEEEKIVYIGRTAQLNAVFTPENTTNKALEWSVSDNSIATVDENGAVTAVSAGSAVITAKSADGGYTASIKILVTDPEMSSVTIKKLPSKTQYTYKSGEALSLDGIELEVAYTDGSKETVTDVSQMKASGFSDTKEGSQTVTVEYKGFEAEFNVTVSYVWWQWIIRILLLGFIWY